MKCNEATHIMAALFHRVVSERIECISRHALPKLSSHAHASCERSSFWICKLIDRATMNRNTKLACHPLCSDVCLPILLRANERVLAKCEETASGKLWEYKSEE